MGDVCRAITFINYHIPVAPGKHEDMEYCTVGFFDGMSTERIYFDYAASSLKEMWRYNLKCASKEEGQYSYQNVFCISSDSWNVQEDREFWSEESNLMYPLTFVVFLQLQNYMVGDTSVGQRCIQFSSHTQKKLNGKGIAYAYGTVDKNDLVICMKCRSYTAAVDAIKELHQMESIVYSYTIFSVPQKLLGLLGNEEYVDIYNEVLPSICLKGVTNTFEPLNKYTLADKYCELCDKLATAFYGEEKEAKRQNLEYKIYDILGEDDFRLIARNVKLGRLLMQYAPGGALCYEEKSFRFYLFSSSMVLNTDTPPGKPISEADIGISIREMESAFSTPVCDKLQEKMRFMLSMSRKKENLYGEKTVTFCSAMWQLLRSLKALEAAPTKMYDFYTLYQPFSLLVDIIKEKMEKAVSSTSESDSVARLENNKEIYNFIHKISMTLHGTLRTDIQFFQIRDFNVIVHYAPAKLRAFYAIWTFELVDYYNSFGQTKNSYSFIFAPGMFRDISVKELFAEYDASRRLMLIVLPERNLYSPDWLLITLAHEVSHFVGSNVRNRSVRHRVLWECCCRILELELRHFVYILTDDGLKAEVENYIKDNSSLLDGMMWQIERINAASEEREDSSQRPYMYHSRNSMERICKVFREYGKYYLDKAVADECGNLNRYLNQEAVRQGIGSNLKEKITFQRELLKQCDSYRVQMIPFFQKFQSTVLEQTLKILRFIMAEGCADLNAVLTNGLLPREYVRSFTDANNDARAGLKDARHTTIRTVRSGLVLTAVNYLVMQNKGWFMEQDAVFCGEWEADVLRLLARDADLNTAEGKFSVSIYKYVVMTRKCSNRISAYRPLYNDSPEEWTFTNHELDFLNDKLIWDAMLSYLNKCACEYLASIQNSPIIIEQKNRLTEVYRTARNGPATEMMMTVESFLQKYEERQGKS